MPILSQCVGRSKEKQDYVVVKAQVDLNRHSTHKAVYLTPANMHTNHLLAHSDCHYCKQVL